MYYICYHFKWWSHQIYLIWCARGARWCCCCCCCWWWCCTVEYITNNLIIVELLYQLSILAPHALLHSLSLSLSLSFSLLHELLRARVRIRSRAQARISNMNINKFIRRKIKCLEVVIYLFIYYWSSQVRINRLYIYIYIYIYKSIWEYASYKQVMAVLSSESIVCTCVYVCGTSVTSVLQH